MLRVHMGEKLTFSSIILKEDGWYVSRHPELYVASQKNVDEALNNLKETIELYLEDEDA
jgi:predicted RNase H-like HicB family nuclease